MKEAIETFFKEDADIIKQRHELREEYKKSLLGIRPQEEMVISRKLRKSKVLEVAAFLLNSNIQHIQVKSKDSKTYSSLAWIDRISKSSYS